MLSNPPKFNCCPAVAVGGAHGPAAALASAPAAVCCAHVDCGECQHVKECPPSATHCYRKCKIEDSSRERWVSRNFGLTCLIDFTHCVLCAKHHNHEPQLLTDTKQEQSSRVKDPTRQAKQAKMEANLRQYSQSHVKPAKKKKNEGNGKPYSTKACNRLQKQTSKHTIDCNMDQEQNTRSRFLFEHAHVLLHTESLTFPCANKHSRTKPPRENAPCSLT